MLAALAVMVVAGCNARIREERGVWNLYAMEEALEQGGNVGMGPTLPAGLPASDFLSQNPAGQRTLQVQRAFADGAPAAYVTSELWTNYDGVWLQPIYAQFIGAELGAPIDSPLVIDVGPESTFYSPFWRVSFAVVGDVPGYRSTTDVLDGASQIIPAGTKTCPLRPLDVVGTGLALPAPWDAWNASIALETIRAGEAVMTEEETEETVGVLDFGHDLFEVTAGPRGAMVAARPMYAFAKPDGALATDEPRVLGSGTVTIDATSGRARPRYGGLWRVYKVTLPPAAGPFHGADHPAARDAAMRGGGDPLDYEGRFALNATTCFADAAANDFPNGCRWLDSEAKLQSLLGAGSVVATEILQTGPLVLYNKQPVSVSD